MEIVLFSAVTATRLCRRCRRLLQVLEVYHQQMVALSLRIKDKVPEQVLCDLGDAVPNGAIGKKPTNALRQEGEAPVNNTGEDRGAEPT